MVINRESKAGKQRETFRCDVEIDGYEVEVYGEIDDNNPMIIGVEGMNEEELSRREEEVYNLVMEEWPDTFAAYCSNVHDSMQDR